jgi:eukaryotic-like serine/threonine-protein kinase
MRAVVDEPGPTVSDDDAVDAPIAAPHIAIERGALIGRYIVIEKLGEGGMGVVYAAYDPELDRKIAIKLLREDHRGTGASSRRVRLMREAQALARLDHPNIVAVYDLGVIDGRVFIAMELVPGETVTAWLAAAPRDWRRIVEVYRQAGRALAAAHALGIVHRDFKPDNVLISDDGGVHVVDFGLATAVDNEADDDASGSASDERLTRAGAKVGTPGFIAPEGGTAATVDQFSFCVALWVALHGELPFAGTTSEELLAAAAKGELREPKRRVPPWLQRVLRRGLAPAPAARFPSMEALIQALSRDRTRIAAAAGIVVVAAAAVGVVAWRGHDSQICHGAAQRIAGAWDPAAIASSFVATRLPYAAASATRVVADLDHYGSAWAAMRTEACEATRVHGEQSEELLDLRMACLDDRARELRALGAAFAHADATTVEKSVGAVRALASLAACADSAGLKDPVRPPNNPALQGAIASARGTLAEARVLDHTGKYKQALAEIEPVVAQAKALGFRPLEASALWLAGVARWHAADLDGAQVALEASVNAAIAARDNATAARSALELVGLLGFDKGKPAEAAPWELRARAFLEAHPDEQMRGELDNQIGNMRLEAGKYDEAIAFHTSALQVRTKLFGADSDAVGGSYDNLGNDYLYKGEPAKSSEYHRRALELETKQLGPMHPRVALTLTNLGGSLEDEGKIAEAIDAEQRAIAIKEQIYGANSAMVAVSVHELGNAYYLQKQWDKAEASYRRVAEVYKTGFGADHPRYGAALGSVANAIRHQHRLDEAGALYRQSLAIRIKALGTTTSILCSDYIGLSQIAQERKQWAEALANAQTCVDLHLKSGVKLDGPELAEPLNHVAASQLGAGHAAEAVAIYKRLVAKLDPKSGDPLDAAETLFNYGRALWETGDHATAMAQVDRASSIATDAKGKELSDDIAAWRTTHH